MRLLRRSDEEPASPEEARPEQPAPKELVQGGLGHEPRGDVRRGRERLQRGRKRLRYDQVADAQARRDGLRERRAVEHAAAAFELEQAWRRLPLEAHEPVRVVLEHLQPPLPHQIGQPAAPLCGKRDPARILERRDRVEQFRRSFPLELVQVQTVVVERDLAELAALVEQDPARPVVGRSLDQHATRPERREDQVKGLQRAVGDDHPPRVDPVPPADPVAQGLVAKRAPVREDRRTIAAKRLAGAVGQLVDRQAIRRGNAARQRDRHAPTPAVAAARSATSVGVVPTRPPRSSSVSFFACAVPDDPEMIAPACPIVLPGGAVKPAMYATTGFVISASMKAAAFSSSSPPISPTSTTSSVSSSASNRASTSVNDEPTTGSPPIPTIVELPSPRWVSSCPIWYVSVPERETTPTAPSRKISAGMIPTFAFPGESAPGQFGPSIVIRFGRM